MEIPAGYMDRYHYGLSMNVTPYPCDYNNCTTRYAYDAIVG